HTVEGGRCRVPAVSLTGYCAVSGEFKTRPCFAWRVAHLCAFAKVGTEGVSSHILLRFTMLPSSCAHPPEALLRSRRSAFRNVPLLSSASVVGQYAPACSFGSGPRASASTLQVRISRLGGVAGAHPR